MPSGNGSSAPLLIATHYWIWVQFGTRERLTEKSLDVILQAAARNNLYLSVFSVWEVGILESKCRLHLHRDCAQWVAEALAMPGLSLAPFTPAIAIDSTRLPGNFHGDPVDRLIVATARALGARLLTSDKNIRAYGRQHHGLLA